MYAVQLGLPPRVTPPVTHDLRVVEPAGRLLTPADVAQTCRELLAPPFDQPVIIDLGSVDQLLSSAAIELCDHISWRVYWSPVAVVVPDADVLQHFRCRSFDRIATIHASRSAAVRALTGGGTNDGRHVTSSAAGSSSDTSDRSSVSAAGIPVDR